MTTNVIIGDLHVLFWNHLICHKCAVLKQTGKYHKAFAVTWNWKYTETTFSAQSEWRIHTRVLSKKMAAVTLITSKVSSKFLLSVKYYDSLHVSPEVFEIVEWWGGGCRCFSGRDISHCRHMKVGWYCNTNPSLSALAHLWNMTFLIERYFPLSPFRYLTTLIDHRELAIAFRAY